jgi:hypothetical protein
MKYVTFAEHQAAKNEIIGGVEYREESTFPNQWGMMSKQYSTEENGTFYEITDPKTGITEFWSDKHPTSRYYDGRTREEIIEQYKAKLAAAAKEKETLEKRIKALRKPTGTNMSQERYTELEKHAVELVGHCDVSTVLTDAEAVLLINKEFGFEAGRIEILHEAEIDVSEEGSRYVKTAKVPRKPVYAATDWNYIRFNVRTAPATWYYEMINADLYTVVI